MLKCFFQFSPPSLPPSIPPFFPSPSPLTPSFPPFLPPSLRPSLPPSPHNFLVHSSAAQGSDLHLQNLKKTDTIVDMTPPQPVPLCGDIKIELIHNPGWGLKVGGAWGWEGPMRGPHVLACRPVEAGANLFSELLKLLSTARLWPQGKFPV